MDEKRSSSTSVRPVRPCVSAVGGAIALGHYFHLHTEVVEAIELGGIARDEKANLRKIAKKRKIERRRVEGLLRLVWWK